MHTITPKKDRSKIIGKIPVSSIPRGITTTGKGGMHKDKRRKPKVAQRVIIKNLY